LRLRDYKCIARLKAGEDPPRKIGKPASVLSFTPIADFIRSHNQTPKPFPWQKTSDEILAAIARFASETINAHS
jgi:hypothetical protein